MANAYAKLWILDTEGMVTAKPVRIRKVVLFPNGGTDHATLSYWGEEAATTTPRATMLGKTAAVAADTYTITSTGNFEAAECVANDIMEITETDGDNIGHWQVGTVSNDNDIIVDIGLAAYGQTGGAMTEESAKTWSWKMWIPSVFAVLSGTDANTPYPLDFGDRGFWLPNLALSTLEASAVVYVYYM